MPGMDALPRLLALPNRSFFVFGPRGVGKTTWLRQMLPPDTPMFDLLRSDVFLDLARDPTLLEAKVGKRGAVVVPARRKVDVGTEIIFEMNAIGLPAPVAVHSEVVHVQENPAGGFLVAVRYLLDDGARAGAMDAAARLMALQQFEHQRSTPRIPVNLPAWVQPSGERAVIADLSLGGLRVVFPITNRIPPGISRVQDVVEVAFREDLPSASAKVVWCRVPPGGVSNVPPAVGLAFTVFPPDTTRAVERILSLADFGPGPKPVTLAVKG